MDPRWTKHFSRRSHFGSVDQRGLAIERVLRGRSEVLDLASSNPTVLGLGAGFESAGFESAGSESARRFAAPYLPDPRGTRAARQAVASSYRDRHPLAPEEVFLTASTSEAYSYLFLALCDPEDAVLVPRPSYPLFDDLARLCSVRLVEYRLAYDGKWHLDAASLPSSQRVREERIRMVLAVSPNNPTGNCLREQELTALSALGLPVVVDEVFRPYRVPGTASLPDPLVGHWSAPLILLDGLSKRACAPGLKLGWMVVRGQGSDALLDRLEWLGDTFLSVNSVTQHWLPELLHHEGEIQRRVNERVRDNACVLDEMLRETPLTVLDREGGWSVIVRLVDVASEYEWLSRLAEKGVRVQAGSLYGLPQSPACVLSLLTQKDVWRKGLTRLLEATHELLAGQD